MRQREERKGAGGITHTREKLELDVRVADLALGLDPEAKHLGQEEEKDRQHEGGQDALKDADDDCREARGEIEMGSAVGSSSTTKNRNAPVGIWLMKLRKPTELASLEMLEKDPTKADRI